MLEAVAPTARLEDPATLLTTRRLVLQTVVERWKLMMMTDVDHEHLQLTLDVTLTEIGSMKRKEMATETGTGIANDHVIGSEIGIGNETGSAIVRVITIGRPDGTVRMEVPELEVLEAVAQVAAVGVMEGVGVEDDLGGRAQLTLMPAPIGHWPSAWDSDNDGHDRSFRFILGFYSTSWRARQESAHGHHLLYTVRIISFCSS